LDQLRNKLSYEWKNIYRLLNSKDIEEQGQAPLKAFESALKSTGVFLTSEDMKKIQEKYGDNRSNINYDQLSKDLGLHQPSFSYMKQTHSKINRLKSAGKISAYGFKNSSKMESFEKRRSINNLI